jgi:hypothetical protein
MRIKLIIYEICIKTMSANGSIGKTRSSEVKKNVNHTHILHVYICIYIYIYITHKDLSIYLTYMYICVHTYQKKTYVHIE